MKHADTKLSRAVATLADALRNDTEFFFAYQSNIAMAFFDASIKYKSRDGRKKIHSIANAGAINFLNLFIRETT